MLPSQAGGRPELSASLVRGERSLRAGGADGSAASSQRRKRLHQAGQPDAQGAPSEKRSFPKKSETLTNVPFFVAL